MSITPLFRTMHRIVNSVTPKVYAVDSALNVIKRQMHHIYNNGQLSLLPNIPTNNVGAANLLRPSLPMYNSVCGMKVRGRLQLRCKDCYYICRRERLYVMCKSHPRHKQTQMKKREYKTWILTHATQSPKRPW